MLNYHRRPPLISFAEAVQSAHSSDGWVELEPFQACQWESQLLVDYFAKYQAKGVKVSLDGSELSSILLGSQGEYGNPQSLLVGCSLKHTNLSRVNLVEVDCTGAHFKRANLTEANVSYAIFENGDLSEIIAIGIKGFKTIFKGAQLYRGNLSRSSLNEADFTGAKLASADLSGSKLWAANFTGAYLIGTDLSGSQLNDVQLISANLKDADLSGTDMKRTNLTGANVRGANFTGVMYLKIGALTVEQAESADTLPNESYLNATKEYWAQQNR
jgi:uncharacterized protein YjbI with pentapeptide repeats